MKSKVYAVLVSYNPSDNILSNVKALIPQVDNILVIDNGSCSNSKKYLEYLQDNYGIYIIYNSENLGIATALNIGVKYAIDAGCFWIATFDQDSITPTNFIDSMLAAYESCNYKENIAIISPQYFDNNSQTILSSKENIETDKLFFEVTTTLTSGNLVKAKIFKEIGLFEDSFFIDYVDHEFCLRCLKNNYKIITSCKTMLNHSLGKMAAYSFMGNKFFTTNHNQLRVYYKSRNRIIVYKRYFMKFSKWVLADIIASLKEIIKIILVEEQSISKLSFLIKGIYHGYQGKMGKHE